MGSGDVGDSNGTDPYPLVDELPAHFVVVRGGQGPLPPVGTPFSGAAGPDKTDAARGIPHGKMRVTTAGTIRGLNGTVSFVPERSQSGIMNKRHVQVVEGTVGAFGEVEPNPVPKIERIR